VTPLQKVAMGLVIVFVSARFGGYDVLADPVGWALVVAGLLAFGVRLPLAGTALTAAVVAGLVALPLAVPQLDDELTASGQWAVSLPQAVFCIVLCTSLTALAERSGAAESLRWGVLRWLFVAVAAGPVLVYGGGLDALATPLAVLAVLANVALVYYLFKVSRRPAFGASHDVVAPVPE
jgi:hypothetical protein